ncbi:ABC transporter substrate-binding protein [Devosia ginsengisoli]|uniref:ABC transporter substrate-binding protein n=1 Tax=Devosia ginsengisoli TaxID=400770 RepID=UPI0026EAF27C|nr:iron-siderophore ABC transporter substrate-binding protein [Devosia ginsengisoli]MCR6670168.1 iron-siderophore ABC transporter substrate-binding protein [Devosia ginsengisoli]
MFRTLLAAALLALGLAAPTAAREITHVMGVTEVPDAPQRVVILTNEGTEALLHLGVVPVGAAQSWDGDPWYDHIAGPLADTVPLGTESGINLEILAALEPDLIIGNKVRQEKIYDQLSAIAPTVYAEDLSGDWQKNYQFYADVLGLHEQGAANLAAFNTRAAAIGASLGDSINETISLVRFSPGRTRIYYKDTFAGVILDKVGLKRPAPQDRQEFAEEVQKERIPDMDGDRIFYFSADADPEEAVANLAEWTNDPLWLNLEGVKAGKAQRVSELVWNTGGGIYCAHMMLDELAAIYGVDPQAVTD